MMKKKIFEYAQFCFAVMVMVKQETLGYKTYTKAADDLNRGDFAGDIYTFLGLKKIDVPLDQIKNSENLVVWNSPHAVYSSNGFYDEFFEGYEGIQPIDQLKIIHGKGTKEYNPLGAYKFE